MYTGIGPTGDAEYVLRPPAAEHLVATPRALQLAMLPASAVLPEWQGTHVTSHVMLEQDHQRPSEALRHG